MYNKRLCNKKNRRNKLLRVTIQIKSNNILYTKINSMHKRSSYYITFVTVDILELWSEFFAIILEELILA